MTNNKLQSNYEDFCKLLDNSKYKMDIRNREIYCKYNKDAHTKGLWIEERCRGDINRRWQEMYYLRKELVFMGNKNITFLFNTDDLTKWLLKYGGHETKSETSYGGHMSLSDANKICIKKW